MHKTTSLVCSPLPKFFVTCSANLCICVYCLLSQCKLPHHILSNTSLVSGHVGEGKVVWYPLFAHVHDLMEYHIHVHIYHCQ